jgi:hypothetical protein
VVLEGFRVVSPSFKGGAHVKVQCQAPGVCELRQPNPHPGGLDGRLGTMTAETVCVVHYFDGRRRYVVILGGTNRLMRVFWPRGSGIATDDFGT